MAQGNLKLAKKPKATTQKKVTPKDMKKGSEFSFRSAFLTVPTHELTLLPP